MTKVSRLSLRPDVWERIFNLFTGTLADIKDRNKLEAFVKYFFSPTERIMFAKRLAAAVLLAKGHDYQSIRKILRLSPPTIAKISIKVKYEGKGLNLIIADILNKQKARILWKEIEDLFDLPTKGSLKSPERFKRKLARSHEIFHLKEEF